MKWSSYPILTDGLPFVVFTLSLTIMFVFFKFIALSIIFFIITLFMIIFFRNPKREIPSDENAIISPADGKIIEIKEEFEDRYIKDKVLKISIFMTLFNVHVNRAPATGKILDIKYFKGKFHSANIKKASEENEKNIILMDVGKKRRLLFIQIAGMIARRIRCYVKEGDLLLKGEPYGAILFGSRVELYLPTDVKLKRAKGEWVKGGETIIGYFQ